MSETTSSLSKSDADKEFANMWGQSSLSSLLSPLPLHIPAQPLPLSSLLSSLFLSLLSPLSSLLHVTDPHLSLLSHVILHVLLPPLSSLLSPPKTKPPRNFSQPPNRRTSSPAKSGRPPPPPSNGHQPPSSPIKSPPLLLIPPLPQIRKNLFKNLLLLTPAGNHLLLLTPAGNHLFSSLLPPTSHLSTKQPPLLSSPISLQKIPPFSLLQNPPFSLLQKPFLSLPEKETPLFRPTPGRTSIVRYVYHIRGERHAYSVYPPLRGVTPGGCRN